MTNKANNLTTLLTFLGIIIVITFAVLLIVLDKDPSTYIGSLTTIVSLIAGLGLIGNRLDKVSKNVNGNQTRLLNALEEYQKRDRENADKALATGSVPVATLDPITEQTVQRIKADRDSLPAHRAE